MISNCANPSCNKPFHYLRGGRLYRFDAPCARNASEEVSNAVLATRRARCAVFFWLCKDCAAKLSLRFNGREVSVMPLALPQREGGPVVALGGWEENGNRVVQSLPGGRAA